MTPLPASDLTLSDVLAALGYTVTRPQTMTLPPPTQSAEAVVRQAEQMQREESYRQARRQFQQVRLMPQDIRRSQELPAMILRGVVLVK